MMSDEDDFKTAEDSSYRSARGSLHTGQGQVDSESSFQTGSGARGHLTGQSTFDTLPELSIEQNIPRIEVHPRYIDYTKAQQQEAKVKGKPVSSFADYDPSLPKGAPIVYGTKVAGQKYKDYPPSRQRSQSDPGYAQSHPEERDLPTDAVGRRNVYGEHFGMPLYGPAEWQQYFRDYQDIGYRLVVIPPIDKPLIKAETDFCKKLGIHFQNKLGSGGFGAVFRCEWHRKDDQGNVQVDIYACKVISLADFTSSNTVYDAVPKMLLEADLTKELDHPNIVKVEHMYSIHDPDTGFPFLRVLLFMHLCDGDLNGIIKGKPPQKMTDDEARPVMIDVCQGLKYLHDNLIIHFDIKPHNILYKDETNGQRVFKLTDFGVARRFQTADTTVTHAPGTQDYKAPELSNRGVTSDAKKADIFSLGSTLLKMLVGNDWKDCRQALWPPNNQGNYTPNAQTKNNVARQYQLYSNALELIYRMTVLEDTRRPTIEQVISGEWFTDSGQPPP